MIWSLTETLRIIEPHLSCLLIPGDTFAHVKALAQGLRDVMSSYYLECRLAENTRQVDFLACVTATDGGRKILGDYDVRGDPPESVLDQSLWNRIRKFFSSWADPTSPLYDQIPHVWCEFDLDASLSAVPLPSLLLCLDPTYFERRGYPVSDKYLTAQGYRQVLDTALGILLAYPLSPQTKKNLFACFALLPADGNIIHVSLMLPRQPPQVKLNIRVPTDQLLEYLKKIRWTGSLVDIEGILLQYHTHIDNVKFQLTIEDTVVGKIDFEFHYDSSSQADPALQLLLAQIVANGLCTPEKRDALLTWPGTFHQTFSYHTWPTSLSKWLDVKIVHHFDRSREAKAYLGFMPGSSLF